MITTLNKEHDLLLEFNDVSIVDSKNRPILNHLSFDIKKGDIIGVYCNNTQEKEFLTLLLQKRLENFTITGSIKENISFISFVPFNTGTSLNPLRKVSAQIKDVLRVHHPLRNLEKVCNPLLSSLGILEKKNDFPSSLSGGMKSRLLLGLSLATNAELIVANDPFNALDSINQSKLIQTIQSTHKNHKTAFMILSTDIILLKKIAPSIIYLQNKEDIPFVPFSFFNPVKKPNSLNLLPFIELKNISKSYSLHKKQKIQALNSISFVINQGERLALVGESGGGKTTIGNIIAGIQKMDTGSLLYKGQNRESFSKKEILTYKKEIALIFQDPQTSINPTFNILKTLKEPFLIHKLPIDFTAIKILCHQTNLNKPLATPIHLLNKEELQILCIVRGLLLKPKLLICDEILSFMDSPTKIEILRLLTDLQELYHFTILFINHDLQVIKDFTTRVIVIKDGNVLEEAPTETIFKNPIHPYTKELVKSLII